MALDLSGISKLGGYLLANEGPLDVRTVVPSKANLTDLVTGRIAYAGMIVYVQNEDTHYTYNGETWATLAKSPETLTIGNQTYNGSEAVTITAANLGLANALHFIGTTTTELSDGSTALPTISGVSYTTKTSGDVVLYESKEFVWNGSQWKELGDGSSHALKTVQIIAGNGLTDGGAISGNVTLNVSAGNGITVGADAVEAKAGNGITVDSTGINHADTSSQTSITANSRTYITGVTLDDYGHVTGLSTGVETVTNTDTKVTSMENHYSPTANDDAALSVDASSTTAATWGSTQLVTGVNLQRDAKGHVTGITVDSIKMPAEPTYTLLAATTDALGGVKIGYTENDQNYPVELSNDGKMFVNVPWTDTDTNTTYSEATTSNAGLMSAADKTKLEGIATNANNYSLPTASTSVKGGIKVGTHLTISSDVLSVNPDFGSSVQVKAGSFNAYSDARLKENFKEYTSDKSILDLPIYKYDYINGAKNQIGCKAQDLQEICPEIVNEGSDGYLSIQESKLVYLLLDEIKKLRQEVDELKRG